MASTTTLADPHLRNLKRSYLALLPPPQVIDICLTFEVYAPIHVKTNVWPIDLAAAIAAIQSNSGTNPEWSAQVEKPFKSPLINHEDPHGSSQPTPTPTLEKETSADSDQNATTESSIDPQLRDRPASEPRQSSTPGPPQPPGPASAVSANSQPPIQPSYPHQTYGFQRPPGAYPHAPYFHVPAGYSPFPMYPPPPGAYTAPSHGHPNPLFPASDNQPPSHHQPPPPHIQVEDLPSYEEMIVEALLDSGDPEGCAPRSLFTWMAEHYPLQSNFRPSASQALQKAFKRGRLEKSNGGRYRLSASWEGGSTSRRTTRRPQTHLQTLGLHLSHTASVSPLYTRAPLAHRAESSTPAPTIPTLGPQPTVPNSYPHAFSGYSSSSTPSPALAPVPPSTAVQSTNQADDASTATDPDGDAGVGSDAWEAAQNILKAINFKSLLSMTNEGNANGAAEDIGPEPESMNEGDHPLPVFAGVGIDLSVDPDNSAVAGPVTNGHSQSSAGTIISSSHDINGRAELQGQLALLAAQLAEIAQMTESVAMSIESEDAHVPARALSDEAQGTVDDDNEENDDNDEMEMVEVPVGIDVRFMMPT